MASAANRPFWEAVHAAFDPWKPVRDPALFVERDPAHNPAHRVGEMLRRPYGDRRFLLVGTPGNGKSSELFHLATGLLDERLVVLLDVYDHFERVVGDPAAADRVQPWELLGLVGLAVLRAAEERFGHPWGDEPKRLARALARLRGDEGDAPEVDVGRLVGAMAVLAGGVLSPAAAPVALAAVHAAEKAGPALRWNFPLGLPGQRARSDQDGEVQALLHVVQGIVRGLQQAYGRRLVLVVDGLDRVRDDEALRRLFVDSSILSEIGCDAVFTASIPLLHRHAQGVRGFAVEELANIPVLDHADPRRAGPGLAFFRTLVDKRLAALRAGAERGGYAVPEAPFPREVVDLLARFSGGVVRDFVKLVQVAVDPAWDADAAAFDRAMAERAIDELRRLKETRLTSDEIDLLEKVAADPDHRLPGDETAYRLLRDLRLLPYPNEHTWYFPHPLLTRSLVKVKTPGS